MLLLCAATRLLTLHKSTVGPFLLNNKMVNKCKKFVSGVFSDYFQCRWNANSAIVIFLNFPQNFPRQSGQPIKSDRVYSKTQPLLNVAPTVMSN